MSDSRHARDLLGGEVQARPRLSPEPVRALIGRLARSAARATAIAEALGDAPAEQATVREVAEGLAAHVATLRAVLAHLAGGDGPGEDT